MAFGLRAVNASGGLTLSSEGMIYGYLGKASLSTVQQPGTSSVNANAGFSRYTITWAGSIIVALPIDTNRPRVVRSMSRSGSVWTIDVHSGNGSTTALGFDVQEACDVFVFGKPITASGWGLAIYNSAHELTGDLSRRPLFFDRYVSFADGEDAKALAGLTRPAFIGANPQIQASATNVGGATPWLNISYRGGWELQSGNITRSRLQESRYTDDGPGPVYSSKPAVDIIVIEASGLA